MFFQRDHTRSELQVYMTPVLDDNPLGKRGLGSLPKQNRRLTATQRGARDAATDVNSDALPAGSRLNENWLCG